LIITVPRKSGTNPDKQSDKKESFDTKTQAARKSRKKRKKPSTYEKKHSYRTYQDYISVFSKKKKSEPYCGVLDIVTGNKFCFSFR
tara:strand:+ start:2042 stop:2299 length:258 start_codon:yes stop_codon:yes gene_type:complete